MLWKLQPNNAFISDKNADLINAYKVVRDYPNELMGKLRPHQSKLNEFIKDGDELAYKKYFKNIK